MALSSEKQTLIWKTLNDTRGKIEPSEYKNYIFGIMFYKFLSEKVVDFVSEQEPGRDYKDVYNDDPEGAYRFIQEQLAYVIEPDDLFSVWQEKIDSGDFSIDNVSDAINKFNSSIAEKGKYDFADIFADMDLTSSRLGNNIGTRTATIQDMIALMSEIDIEEDSDVLGDLYEYLIGMFAANSGAKAGEFYTPHEVSDVMARLLTSNREHLKEYSLYDPAMGSGSLLLTTASYMKDAGSVKYFGQELITTTYNLARMNLMMHGVAFNDMTLRNADTLKNDWPDGEVEGKNSPRMFDAVMANPPYSLKWDNKDREDDVRFKLGVAPTSAADYAFLLHSLYHLKQNGRMAIVLPHGVLFRGNAEEKIRKNLLLNNNISAIIGLPNGLFTNTPISTLIMVLEKNRENTDVLFIDASKGFEKQKSSNKLRLEDIEKISSTFDAFKNGIDTGNRMADVDKYAHVATMDEIEENNFNLNIPRYVDTFEAEEPVDAQELSREMKSINEEEISLLKDINSMMDELVAIDSENEDYLQLIKEVLK